jgi:predicted permease
MHDLVVALRQFRKNPGFALTVIVTLALGIGANTAIFTLVHAVLLRSLPVQDPKMLFRLGDKGFNGQSDGMPDPAKGVAEFSWDFYRRLQQNIPVLNQLAAMQSGQENMNVRRGQEPAKSHFTEYVSGNYFQTLGVGSFSGRTLTPGDDTPSAAPAAVISYAAWQADYGSDPKVVGQTFQFQNHPVTIIGIAPAGFYGDRLSATPAEFWLPLSTEPLIEGSLTVLKTPNISWLDLIARLPKGTNTTALESQISIELRHWMSTIPAFQKDTLSPLIPRQHIVITPGGAGVQNLQDQESKGLYLLMAICLLVLLVACANVANLLLARGTAQRADVSLRMALGAPRTRLLRQMITESLLLAFAGGVAGLIVAYSGTITILALAFPDSPQLPIDPNPSLPVLGFTLVLAVLTGFIFGIVPALITSHADPAEALRGANRSTRDRASLPQRWLVIFQTVLSLVLLVSAGMFTRSLGNLQHQNLGIDTSNRYVVHFDPQGQGYTAATLPALYQSLQDRFAAIPGVAEVGLALYSPLEQVGWRSSVYIAGRPAPPAGGEAAADWDRVSPDYFKAIGQAVVRGRTFSPDDTAASRGMAVVNRAFAQKHFPGQNPVGQHFGRRRIANANDYEIIGVVENAKYDNPAEPAPEMFFLPLAQAFKPAGAPVVPRDPTAASSDDKSMYMDAIVLHFNTPPGNVDSLVRNTFAAIDPNLPVSNLHTFSYQVSSNFNQDLLLSRLAALFGALALVLAAIGLYGVTSYQVSRRTNEIGVRMALGATRGSVLWTVLKEALRQVGLGLAIGLPIALLFGHAVKSQLFEVRAYDPLSLAFALATLLASALMAGFIPARRAATTDPVKALRTE